VAILAFVLLGELRKGKPSGQNKGIQPLQGSRAGSGRGHWTGGS